MSAPGAVPSPAELAAHLAARLCHDLIGPVTALVSGLDLAEDPASRADAMGLIAGSARKLVAALSFARAAYGAAGSAQTFDPGELEAVARALYAAARAELDWAVGAAPVARTAGRILLTLAQLGVAVLPMGGVARLSLAADEGGMAVTLEATGARARLSADVQAGLAGEPAGDALPGRWIQAYYLHVLVAEAGGRLETAAADGQVTVRARLPA